MSDVSTNEASTLSGVPVKVVRKKTERHEQNLDKPPPAPAKYAVYGADNKLRLWTNYDYELEVTSRNTRNAQFGDPKPVRVSVEHYQVNAERMGLEIVKEHKYKQIRKMY